MNKINLFSVLMLFFFCANAQDKPKVLATATMIADMTANIAGDLLDVNSIVPIGGDPHIYDPTPSDAQIVSRAQLILKNGLTFEGWLDDLIDNSGTKANVVTVTEGISPISSLQYQNSSDPHAWMDVTKAIQYIENIKNALIKLAPEEADVFEFNHGVYKKQLEDLDQYILDQMKQIPIENRILITSHDAFQYYGRRYGIQLEAILGISTDAEAQTADITRLNKTIREKKVPAIFVESTINPKLIQQIAKDNNITIGGKLYADSLGDKDGVAGTYIDMLKYNTDVIVAALSVKKETGNTPAPGKEEESNSPWLSWGILAIILIGGLFFMIKKMNQ